MPQQHTAEIPYGIYWSTPFARWQGAFANLHSVEFAAHVAKDALKRRGVPAAEIDFGVLGLTVPQAQSFYGLPWLTGMIGAPEAGGPTIMQACATSVACLKTAAAEVDSGAAATALVVTCDRTSNGPHIYYPNPRGPGGTGRTENWVLDNFTNEPLDGHEMVDTAENCAERWQITTEQQHEVVLRRQEQYRDALANDHAFQKRYMSLPFEVPDPRYRKTAATLDGDEGVQESSAEGLAALRPVKPDGTVTHGGQTYPADGNAAIMVTSPARARELSTDAKIAVRIRGFGIHRAELAYMPAATPVAAMKALDAAGLTIADMDAIKTHNPFAVNDVVFAKETGADLNAMNNYGCSLIWGHPQAPMGLRAIIELIEELALRGGGKGLFSGCAAGDTAMCVVLEVGDA